jgi:hypothetical protein
VTSSEQAHWLSVQAEIVRLNIAQPPPGVRHLEMEVVEEFMEFKMLRARSREVVLILAAEMISVLFVEDAEGAAARLELIEVMKVEVGE